MRQARTNQRNGEQGRRRLWFSAVLLAVVFLAVLAAFFVWQKRARTREEISDTERISETVEAADAAKTGEEIVGQEKAEPAPAALADLSGGTVKEPLQSELSEGDLNVSPAEDEAEAEIAALLASMTLEEKICQMLFVTPEELTGYETVTAAGEATKEAYARYPVGGLIYFKSNLIDPEQTKAMLKNTSEYALEQSGIPVFLAVDEEGGSVTRIASNAAFDVKNVGPMGRIADEESAFKAGSTIGAYLSALGFNLDFAPDADVLTNPKNQVIGDRSFGTEAETVTRLAAAYSDGLHSAQVLSTFKHFPGHGATEADTHEGYAYTDKTYEELMNNELMPFQRAAAYGVDFVMTAHISVPGITGDDTPTSLSYRMVTEILRNDLGYDGIIITDALGMGAVANHYTQADAAVLAVKAGNDMLLMTTDLPGAVSAIAEAVRSGEISEGRIDESVARILRVKRRLF